MKCLLASFILKVWKRNGCRILNIAPNNYIIIIDICPIQLLKLMLNQWICLWVGVAVGEWIHARNQVQDLWLLTHRCPTIKKPVQKVRKTKRDKAIVAHWLRCYIYFHLTSHNLWVEIYTKKVEKFTDSYCMQQKLVVQKCLSNKFVS